MPANKKYLIRSPWARVSKLCAALFGGMLASISLHLVLALWLGVDYVIPTSLFSIFILWACFMVLVYWVTSPWRAWGLLLLVILFSVLGIYLLKHG